MCLYIKETASRALLGFTPHFVLPACLGQRTISHWLVFGATPGLRSFEGAPPLCPAVYSMVWIEMGIAEIGVRLFSSSAS